MPLRRDEAVVALPVAHIMGFAVLLGLACSGVPAYVLARFRPDDVLDALEQRRATIFVGVPAMYRLLLEAGAEERDLSSVRVWASGADVMPADLAERFQRLGATAKLPFVGPVGKAVFFEGYGLAESAGAVAVKASLPLLDRLLPGDSVGTPLPGYRFKVVDDEGRPVRPGQVGELWVKGPGVTPGYWGDVSATEAVLTDDGWLRTGDLARRGPLGTVRFSGRSKHVIKRGGYSVYAVEVEAALEEHPAVVEAAVVGLPDERLGEVPAAAVRLAAGQHRRRPPISWPSPPSTSRPTRCRCRSWWSTSCPAPAARRSRRTAWSSSSIRPPNRGWSRPPTRRCRAAGRGRPRPRRATRLR